MEQTLLLLHVLIALKVNFFAAVVGERGSAALHASTKVVAIVGLVLTLQFAYILADLQTRGYTTSDGALIILLQAVLTMWSATNILVLNYQAKKKRSTSANLRKAANEGHSNSESIQPMPQGRNLP